MPGGLPSSSSFSASDFGAWNQAAGASSYNQSIGPQASMGASVRQNSVIGDAFDLTEPVNDRHRAAIA
jgi:hypothetical protein